MRKRYMFGNFSDTNLPLGEEDIVTINVEDNESVLEALDKFMSLIRVNNNDKLTFKTIRVGGTFKMNSWKLDNGTIQELIINNISE